MTVPSILLKTSLFIAGALSVHGITLGIKSLSSTHQGDATKIDSSDINNRSGWEGDLEGNVDEGLMPEPARAPTSCFEYFFPEVEMPYKYHNSSSNSNNDEMMISDPVNSKVSDKSIGCAIMKIFPTKDDDNLFVFFSDIVAKNENIGWAFRVHGSATYEKGAYSQNLAYSLLLLEKQTYGAWAIRGGYEWVDNGSTTSDKPTLYISGPEGKMLDPQHIRNLFDKSGGEKVREVGYQGFWEPIGNGSEVFKSILIRGGELFRSIEVFGKDGGKFDSPVDAGYRRVITGLKSGKWALSQMSGANLDISNVLTSWYKPFVGQKGTWKSMDKYCRYSKFSSRNWDELKGWCVERP